MGSGESDGKTVGEGVGVSNEGSVEDAGGRSVSPSKWLELICSSREDGRSKSKSGLLSETKAPVEQEDRVIAKSKTGIKLRKLSRLFLTILHSLMLHCIKSIA